VPVTALSSRGFGDHDGSRVTSVRGGGSLSPTGEWSSVNGPGWGAGRVGFSPCPESLGKVGCSTWFVVRR